jgi:hypothetical protein
MTVLGRLPGADSARTARLFLGRFGAGRERLRVLGRYLGGRLFADRGDEAHLRAAMSWLADAQDACGGEGVANAFFLDRGWGWAYPETSGYILATFLSYADHSGETGFVDRAKRIGDWEIAIQAPSGGDLSSTELPQTRVFNTGQVILGWCALLERTGRQEYLRAAVRAGDYLLALQEDDGAWRKDTYCGARTYHARVDWALLRLAQASGERRYAEAAARNVRWVLGCQIENGWFERCGFDDDPPITHVLAYTLRGLLESALADPALAEECGILPAVTRSADAVCRAAAARPVAGIPGMVPASFDRSWRSPARDSCLTGNAQLACFLYRLSHCTGNQGYREAADGIVSATKRTQLVRTRLRPLRGAVAGTFPLAHGYVANGYPNWAAKFLADALLMKLNFDKRWVVPA